MTPDDLDFIERAPGRWEAVTRTGREFTITWASGLWAAQQLGPDGQEAVRTLSTFRRAVLWCVEQCSPDDEEPF